MSTHARDLESRVDSNQRRISFGAAAGTILLALQHLIPEAHLPRWLEVASAVLSLAAWTVFLIGMRQNYKLFKTPEGRLYRKRLEGDERLSTISRDSFTWGFAAMLGAQVVLLLLYTVFDPHALSIPVAATGTIAVGVAAAVLRHQILSNR